MQENIRLNAALLRKRVPNLTAAAKTVGLRPATVSNLCTGKIPVGRAEVRTIVALAELAGCSLDELILKGESMTMLETGIKVVDLFAPMIQGGTTGIVARAQIGQLVLLAEVFERLRKQGYRTVLLVPQLDKAVVEEVRSVSDALCTSIDEAFAEVNLAADKEKVVLAADRAFVLNGKLFQLRERLDEAGIAPITTLLFDPTGEAVDEEDPYGPLDTLWQLDVDLAARRLYPAVSPVHSVSALIESGMTEAGHMAVWQKAKKLLRRYREIRSLVNALGFDKIPEADQQTYRRGERLEAFFSQPFYVAEPFTKKTGENVNLRDVLHGVQRILDGAADGWEVQELAYIGGLPSKR
ncbi:ATP synthase beta subunit C-terminal domain-containing protein [Ectobacillus ponti]|uniref:ATP synthase A/B type C-terminal domain-containing protein n=1 Tax=Ectobacillus ponti TaxID=2961894 RepID=A0AA41XCP7_9BACI|nr:hypothetical protein [Ectobacillus ponti]MCP8969661.1 hypothetical protein [Ectobacillus ponti]